LPHPKYNISRRFDDDVGLVLFDKPGFEIHYSVRPICLWNEDYDLNKIQDLFGEVSQKFGQAIISVVQSSFILTLYFFSRLLRSNLYTFIDPILF